MSRAGGASGGRPMGMLGIMQGRLLPPEAGRFQCFPRDGWALEFPLAHEAGLGGIEWIYDAWGAEVNPIADDAGIKQVRQLSRRHGVAVRSLCADWFMDFPLLRAADDELRRREDRLAWLLGRCRMLGITRIVLPFVDASRIDTPAETAAVAALLGRALPAARETGVEIHLETSLEPARFAALLAAADDPMIRVNYDSGNSASLGYDVREEFDAYGRRVGSVHIKDRTRGAGTVPLGPRGPVGDETAWARRNRAFVEDLLARFPAGTGGA